MERSLRCCGVSCWFSVVVGGFVVCVVSGSCLRGETLVGCWAVLLILLLWTLLLLLAGCQYGLLQGTVASCGSCWYQAIVSPVLSYMSWSV